MHFNLNQDVVSRRQHATRVHFLAKGSVSFEIVSNKRYVGVVEQEAAQIRNIKSPSKVNKYINIQYYLIKKF